MLVFGEGTPNLRQVPLKFPWFLFHWTDEPFRWTLWFSHHVGFRQRAPFVHLGLGYSGKSNGQDGKDLMFFLFNHYLLYLMFYLVSFWVMAWGKFGSYILGLCLFANVHIFGCFPTTCFRIYIWPRYIQTYHPWSICPGSPWKNGGWGGKARFHRNCMSEFMGLLTGEKPREDQIG